MGRVTKDKPIKDTLIALKSIVIEPGVCILESHVPLVLEQLDENWLSVFESQSCNCVDKIMKQGSTSATRNSALTTPYPPLPQIF